MSKTYSEKLLDPRWQRKRLTILSRDEFHCTGCGGDTDTLHVHHVAYIKGRDPWDYEDNQLLTLCSSCHKSRHESMEELAMMCSKYSNAFLDELMRYARARDEWMTKAGRWVDSWVDEVL